MRHAINVGDDYRTNELSMIPGGSTVTIVHANGKSLSYDKIKNVDSYANKAKKDKRVVEILVGGRTIWKR